MLYWCFNCHSCPCLGEYTSWFDLWFPRILLSITRRSYIKFYFASFLAFEFKVCFMPIYHLPYYTFLNFLSLFSFQFWYLLGLYILYAPFFLCWTVKLVQVLLVFFSHASPSWLWLFVFRTLFTWLACLSYVVTLVLINFVSTVKFISS